MYSENPLSDLCLELTIWKVMLLNISTFQVSALEKTMCLKAYLDASRYFDILSIRSISL